jgi:glycosyltransferase involved in cell wall biosynthesis
MVADTPYISVVSPVYMGEKMVDALVTRVIAAISEITPNFEISLVEDGSPDGSWVAIACECLKDQRVKGVKLSRNFGQHNSITAGLTTARGEWIVVMDCDLQDRPEEIPLLYEKASEGFDLVYAARIIRQDNWLKRLSSKAFYAFFSYMTGTPQDNSIANFGIYNRKVIDAILMMGDHIRYFPTMSQWVGFKKTKLEVKHGNRGHGRSSYTWKKLFLLAWDNIIAFSDKPLRLTVMFGLVLSLSAFLGGFFYLIQYFRGKIEVLGFASVIISIWFLSGAIILVIGITGIYIGKVFEIIKRRPTYIVEKTIN